MSQSSLMQSVDARSASALASGALQPVQSEQIRIEQEGLPFVVRWVSSLAAKDASKPAAIPGGPRDPNFNPFLNPDPELTVGPLGDTHVAILNKFPLSVQHLVLACREFEEQLLPLTAADFTALARVMTEAGGLGLYNGGTAAGASQRHKHVQWIPSTDDNAGLALFSAGLPQDLPPLGVARHPALSMQHCFVRVHSGPGMAVEQAAANLQQAWEKGCAELGLQPGADRLMPPYNMLAGDGWMLLIPRSQEQYEGISLSAICFGGTLYTRTREQVDLVQQAGPLQVLAEVGFGRL
ncbi:ATP adenylyltransferase family protein [Brachymonas denitrificans]|uniref:ATP adenylyltransferase n=1 Tax=Brachymonas denitrificans DSM 15123 TaxID=1121117 RepID=A0A1H8E6N4_9BURK|nr:phosphorylase [Brachymonas denitrificans]SEN15155.1 ATP adenylyltransferase [Brachymonas denitrificans DSM 15123]